MQKEEITKYVLNALGRHHSHSDIVQYLCEHAGMPWSEAEKLVRQIAVSHGSEINARQSPLVIALGIIGMISGIGMIAYCAFYFVSFMPRDTVDMVRSGRGALHIIIILISGIGMVTGSLIGMWKTIQELFEHKDNR